MDLNLLFSKITAEMDLIETIYDKIRLVDPVKKKIHLYLKPDTINTEELDESCYEIWDNGTVCINCISSRALILNKTLVKIEIKNSRVFLVTSIPVEREDYPLVIELVKDITDSGILEIEGKNISEIRKLVNQKNLKIISDVITRVFNEEFIFERLPYDIIRSQEQKEPLSLIYLEVDNLKKIHDIYGFKTGDHILKEIAKILRNYRRSHEDWTARFNDSGFLIILHNTNERQTYEICKRISDRLGRIDFKLDGKAISVKKNLGWYVLHNEKITTKELIEKVINKTNSEKETMESENLQRSSAEFFKKFYLTSREIEIADLVLKGYSNAKIAQELFVGVPTVKKHLSAILEKSGTMTRHEFSAKYRQAVI